MTDSERDRILAEDDPVEVAKHMTLAVRGLDDRMTLALKQIRRRVLVLIVCVVGLAGVGGVAGWALHEVRNQARCTTGLAAASADRTGQLADLNQKKNVAFDTYQKANATLLLDALSTAGETPGERVKDLEPDAIAFKAAAQTYQAAVDAYNTAFDQHPPPRVTEYHC